MNQKLVVCLVAGGLLWMAGCKERKITLVTNQDKLSYAIGMNYGKRIIGDLKRQDVEVDSPVVAAAIADVLNNRTLLLTDKEAQEVITAFQQEQRVKQEEEAKKKAEANIKAGNEFLEDNKKQQGVVALPSGLQYKTIKKGTGKKPTRESSVQCHYRGTLIDGTEFDSSYKRGQPATFAVGGVIPGWTEALQLMQEGARWQLFIPAHLAYGNREAGPLIKPGSTLIFEIELIKVN